MLDISELVSSMMRGLIYIETIAIAIGKNTGFPLGGKNYCQFYLLIMRISQMFEESYREASG